MSENSFRLDAPLVGFRTWYSRPLVPQSVFSTSAISAYPTFAPKPLALYPMTSEIPWTGEVNEAVCHSKDRMTSLKTPHISPHADCYCGLHGYHKSERNREIEWISHLFDRELMIRGVILMWGQIYGGEDVIRSQFAEIVGICDESTVAKLIAKKHKVPCVSEEHLIYLATEHGERASDELIERIREHTEEATALPKDFPKGLEA